MKKTLALFLSVALLVALTSCGAAITTPDPPEPPEDSVLVVEPISIPSGPAKTQSETPSETPSEPIADAPDQPKMQKILYLRSKTDGLNVRAGAGTNYAVLGALDKDDMVAYYGQTGDWYETVYRNKTAYVSAKYLSIVEFSPADDQTEAVVALGCRLLGTPYVYGATRLHDGKGNFLSGFSDQKFDCSSFMQYLFYYGKGFLLDVTTRTQVKQGDAVELSEIKRGDLLFFTNASRKNNVGIEKIGHVALYLGDGYLLHTASDHAVIEPLSPTRRANLLFARRF